MITCRYVKKTNIFNLIRNVTLQATYQESLLQPQSLGQLHACGSGGLTFLYLPDFSFLAVSSQQWRRIQPFLEGARRQIKLLKCLKQSLCYNF